MSAPPSGDFEHYRNAERQLSFLGPRCVASAVKNRKSDPVLCLSGNFVLLGGLARYFVSIIRVRLVHVVRNGGKNVILRPLEKKFWIYDP